MAVPANAVLTFGTIGIREDLTDAVTMIDPTETPFYSGVRKEKVKAQYHEWQTDSLAAASSTNKHIEGDDSTLEAQTSTVRVGNRCQIMKKVYGVSGSLQAANLAGRDGGELGRLRMNNGLALKRDIESTLLNSQASSAGSTTAGAALGGLPNWLTTYTGNSGAGTTPGFSSNNVAAVVDSTVTATFVESDLQTITQTIWENGGKPDVAMMGAFNKRQGSNFGGIATLQRDVGTGPAYVVGAVDVYGTDWGDIAFIPNRFQRARDVLILEMSKFAVGFYRPIKREDLAKTGDSKKEHMVTELTLIVDNEKSSGKIVDRATS